MNGAKQEVHTELVAAVSTQNKNKKKTFAVCSQPRRRHHPEAKKKIGKEGHTVYVQGLQVVRPYKRPFSPTIFGIQVALSCIRFN